MRRSVLTADGVLAALATLCDAFAMGGAPARIPFRSAVRNCGGVLPPENHAERLAGAVRDAMGRERATLSALESCTGGLLASILTDVPGAGYFLGGAVAYSPEAKQSYGVPGHVIQRYGLVSAEVAIEMAKCAAEWFHADYGVGITGVAGPDAEDGIPPGTGFAAVWGRKRNGRVLPMDVRGDRKSAKAMMASLALGLLLEEVERPRGEPLAPMVAAWLRR